MTFYEVLEQVVALLQRHGRVSYRALKRQFDVDDAFVADLKAELLDSAHPVRDEDGQALVWIGGTTGPAQPDLRAEPSDRRLGPAPEIGTPEAERRQLTVMFCDLADSTALSARLDPEDLREVLRAYQEACTAVVDRFDGYIAQYLGDGVLIYFGYPRAHEDDGRRAVSAGLGILEATHRLSARLQADRQIRLAVRVGIHTGPVVVGDVGAAGRREQLALGETPNVAARIQGMTALDTVAISATTHRLVRPHFECEDLGPQALKGVEAPIGVFRVLRAREADGGLEGSASRRTPLVGREQEVGLLVERWERVREGMGQIVLLTGEPGIGKSRLVHMLKDRVARETAALLEARGSPYHQNTALFPVTDLLERTWGFERHESLEEKLAKLERALTPYRGDPKEMVPLFASLLSLPIGDDRYPPLQLAPSRQRQKTLEAILALLSEMAGQGPVLLILEDLHWMDPSTLELLERLIDQGPTTAILTLLTCRPTFRPSWALRGQVTPIALNRLTRNQVDLLARWVAGGKELPPAIVQQLALKADGVPLFVEELTKTVLESGLLREAVDRYELTGPVGSLAIPETLQDSLMARLDRLGPAKGLAQLGATAGRTFPYSLLQAVSGLDDATLQRGLDQLVEAELLYQRGAPPQATYAFKHALLQEAAYQSLLRRTRQQYHQQIARVLVEAFPETTGSQPELLAHHYTEAGQTEQAIGYWQRAGERAAQRSAHAEAIAQLGRGLEILAILPETPERARSELTLLTRLRLSLAATRGYAARELEQVNARLRTLCELVGEPTLILGALGGLWPFYLSRAELGTARELAEQALALAQRVQSQRAAVLPIRGSAARPFFWGHVMLGQTLLYLGELSGAREQAELAVGLYDRQLHRPQVTLAHQDPGVTCLATAAQAQWLLGSPDQATRRSAEALTLARELGHPETLAWVLSWAATLAWQRRESREALERSDAAVVLATEHGFAEWAAQGAILRGWALAFGGRGDEGLQLIREGLAAYRATGSALLCPLFLAILAEACASADRADEGRARLAEALRLTEATGERWFEAELLRLDGELCLGASASAEARAEAEVRFQKALDLSRHQQAKMLELRTATSLGRLWCAQGKQEEARRLVGDVYRWFTAGLDTPDLLDAKALLEEGRR